MSLDGLKGAEVYADPVKGWKVATVGRLFTGKYALVPSVISNSGTFPLRGAVASCYMPPYLEWREGLYTHNTPDINGRCMCGFNAYLSPTDALNHHFRMVKAYEQVLLEVDLYGTVVEYVIGYRAEKQDVIGIYADLSRLRIRSVYEIERDLGLPIRDFSVLGIGTTVYLRPALTGTVLRSRFIRWRDVITQDTRDDLCEICYAPIEHEICYAPIEHQSVRCKRHQPERMVAPVTKGHPVPPELRYDKRGKPYVYIGYGVTWGLGLDIPTRHRATVVFRNKDSWTVTIVWQKRVLQYDGLVSKFPTWRQSFVVLDRVPWKLFTRRKGKLVESPDKASIRTAVWEARRLIVE
jgi:hypothetical protein